MATKYLSCAETAKPSIEVVNPWFHKALAPFAPPALRPFAVSIKTATEPEDINVMAYTSCDAICKAIDLFFDGDESMPLDGLVVIASPLDTLPMAA